MSVFASILESSQSIKHALSDETVKAYVHNIMTSGYRPPSEDAPKQGSKLTIKAGDQQIQLGEGDGLFIEDISPSTELIFESEGGQAAEFLLFELTSTEGDEDDM
jgi:hypothetical protein